MRRLAVLLLLVVTLTACASPALTVTPSPSPAASTLPSPPPASNPAASPAARYPDGIPAELDGEPVLRGDAALARARAMDTADPFLVGAWLDVYTGPRFCPIETQTLPPDSWLQLCQPIISASDEAGAEPSSLVAVPAPDARVTFRFAAGLHTGPAVLRVHVHDPRAVQCGDQQATCDALMVVEAAVWSGDARTDPRPVSVAAALAAVERAAPGTGLRALDDAAMASWALLRGGTRLAPPDDRSLDPSRADGVVLAASVLPSADAVGRALPGVTPGPAGALLGPAVAGEWGGSDPTHAWSFVNRWLVVDNVAVLVSTLPSPSAADRALLARLADALRAEASAISP